MILKLLNKKPETSDVTTFIFQPETPLVWKAGQFFRYQIPNPSHDEKGESRFFTISSAPFEENIQISTKFPPDKVSTFKQDLQKLEIGQEIEGYGPSGSFTLNYPEENYVFIAGGIGITPFRSILLQLAHEQKPINVKLLYASRTQEIVFKDELEALKANNPNFSIQYFIGEQKIDESTLQPLATQNPTPTFYLSGPEPMVESFEKILLKFGVPDEKIRRDYFPGYTEI